MMSLELEELFVEDKDLLHAELDNGLRYYIQENHFDENKASLRLAVNVGSVMETESERGVAHFIEHLVFRGSKHFKDQEVIQFLESIGAGFGGHTNAYTSFDQTVYMLDLPIKNKEILEKGIAILSDFAFFANLHQKEIELEKGVVLDEMRQRESATSGRLSQRLLECFLKNTEYENRLPIGIEEVIKNSSETLIQSFYKKWYRPENMAIIAVGDFDKNTMLELIKKSFYLNQIGPKAQFRPKAFVEGSLSSHIEKNPDMFGSLFFIGKVFPKYNKKLLSEYIKNFTDELVLSALNRRLSHLSQAENAPFQSAGIYLQHLIKEQIHLISQIVAWDKKPLEGLKAFLEELSRAYQHDFSNEELDLIKNKIRSELDGLVHQLDQRHNTSICQEILESFIRNDKLLSKENEIKLEKALLDSVTNAMVNQRKKDLLNIDHSKILFFPSDQVEPIDEHQILRCAINSKSATEDLSCSKVTTLNLDSGLKTGKILNSFSYQATDVHEWTLENGMRVIFKPTLIQKESVQVTLFARSGLNRAKEEDYPSASVAFQYLHKAGLFGLSGPMLSDALSSMKVGINYHVDFNRTISGFSSKKDLKALFKLIQGLFIDRTSSPSAFQKQKDQVDQHYALEETSSDIKFSLTLGLLNTSDHYSSKIFNSKQLSQKKMEDFLKNSLSKPSEFTLIITGDTTKSELEKLTKVYLASIEEDRASHLECFDHLVFPKGVKTATVPSKGSKDESLVVIAFPLKSEALFDQYKTCFFIDLIEDILTRKCLERLRIQEGDTYGVYAQALFPFYPKFTSGKIYFIFSCHLEKSESMQLLLFEELKKAMSGQILEDELDKAYEIYKHKEAKNNLLLSGIKDRLLQNVLFNCSFETLVVDEQTKKRPTREELVSFLKSSIDLNNYTICKKEPEGR